MRVVGTLTTLPDRYDRLYQTLCSLRNQTHTLNVVYLSLPKRAKRLQKDYPPLPREIAELCTPVECEDYGPITKLSGALLSEQDPNTLIISFDDDIIYPKSIVDSFLRCHLKYPNAALCATAALIKYSWPFVGMHVNITYNLKWVTNLHIDQVRKIDIVFGSQGVLYKRSFFPSPDQLESHLYHYALESDDVFFNDDILISGYLQSHNIDRLLVPDIEPVIQESVKTNDAISHNISLFTTRFTRAVKFLQERGMLMELEAVSITETVGFKVLLAVVLILFLIALVVLFFCV